MAEKYLRKALQAAIVARVETIKPPAYHFRPVNILPTPEELPDPPQSTPVVYVHLGREVKAQDQAAQINTCTIQAGVLVGDVDYSDPTDRAVDLAGDVERALGRELNITDADGVTLTVPVWLRIVDPVVFNGTLWVSVGFDLEYEHRTGDPARF